MGESKERAEAKNRGLVSAAASKGFRAWFRPRPRRVVSAREERLSRQGKSFNLARPDHPLPRLARVQNPLGLGP